MENATWFTCGCEYPEYEVTAFALNRYGFPIFSSPVGNTGLVIAVTTAAVLDKKSG